MNLVFGALRGESKVCAYRQRTACKAFGVFEDTLMFYRGDNNLNKDNCAIVVCSCDNYADTWNPFFTLLKKYWVDCPYNIFLNTETLQYSHPDFDIKVINFDVSGASWTARLANTIKQVQSEQVLLMLDDFFLYDVVDTKKVAQCVEWIEANGNIATFTIGSVSTFGLKSEYKGFLRTPSDDRLVVRCIAGVWNKSKLLWYLSHDESAWEWESGATNRSYQTDDEFYIMEERGLRFDIIPYCHYKYGLIGGKWISGTETIFEDNGIELDFSIRGFFDWNMMALSPSFINGLKLDSCVVPYYALTHDGDPCISSDVIIEDSGPFKQTYCIKGARKLIRWEPSFLFGFKIKNVKATFLFEDETVESVGEHQVFGNCVYFGNTLFFVKSQPTCFFTVRSNALIDSVTIEGEFLKTLSEGELKCAIELPHIPTPQEQMLFATGIWREKLLTKNHADSVLIKPRLIIDDNTIHWPGEFLIKYPVNAQPGSTLCWQPSHQSYFSIEDFSISAKVSDDTQHELQFYSKQDSFCQIKTHTVFAHPSKDIFVTLPDFKIDAIIISGIIHNPIPNTIMRSLVYGDASDDEVRAMECTEQTSNGNAIVDTTSTEQDLNNYQALNNADSRLWSKALRGIKKYGAIGVICEVLKRAFNKYKT